MITCAPAVASADHGHDSERHGDRQRAKRHEEEDTDNRTARSLDANSARTASDDGGLSRQLDALHHGQRRRVFAERAQVSFDLG